MSSSAAAPAAVLELEDEIKPYRERIERIDDILEGPVRTLVREAIRAAKALDDATTAARKAAEEKAKNPRAVPTPDGTPPDGPAAKAAAHEHSGEELAPRFQLWIAHNPVRNPWPNALTTSLCLVTLHRLYRMRRRFPGLKKEMKALGEALDRLRLGYLPDRETLGSEFFARCAHFVDSRTFGFLNPFSSAQVFRLLMESGEDHAHTGVGCLSFFAMVWPLYRSTDPLDVGARIEPYLPTAYVTSKCLLPLIELRAICLKRARLFKTIKAHLNTLDGLRKDAPRSSRSHWKFCAEMDSLRRHLREMAEISISRQAFDTCEENLAGLLEDVGPRAPLQGVFDSVVRELAVALQGVEARSATLLGDAEHILQVLHAEVITPLRAGTVPSKPRRTRHGKLIFSEPAADAAGADGFDLAAFRFDFPEAEQPTDFAGYLQELGASAAKAAALCENILMQLKLAAGLNVVPLAQKADDAQRTDAIAQVHKALETMVNVNAEVAHLVSERVDVHTRWCHNVVNRHVAFAAASNFTDFDPSELLSGLAVVVRNKDLMTEGEVANALEKAVVAREPDGSWRLGHPYFSSDGLQALRAPAADMVWTLVSAVAQFPAVRVADEALFSFVEWLERTRREIPVTRDPMAELKDYGWSADQMREQDRLELFTTAYAVNALMAVRDLAEHRLWELCERRFTIIRNAKRLDEMAPVDLMVPHGHRLHSRLARMMSDTHAASEDATYSMVLHGPPGSSKTTVAGALSHAMGGKSGRWGRERRLVRVTPADFTRLGEDRVDAQAHAIFELLRHVRGATILFDEIDDLLRRREFTTDKHPRFLDLVIPAMLNRLQDLRDACEQQEICFLFGTNYVERIEPALMRRGRIDEIIPVPYPDQESRRAIAEEVLELSEVVPPALAARPEKDDPQREAKIAWQDAWKTWLLAGAAHIAPQTGGWSWSGVRGIAKKVRGDIRSRFGGFDLDVMPDKVVRDWDWEAYVERLVLDNPPDIRTDTIYPDRLRHGMDSRELRQESLRHLLTYCTSADGHPLLEELRDQVNALAMADVKPLHTDTHKFLEVLGLLNERNGAAAAGNGAGT